MTQSEEGNDFGSIANQTPVQSTTTILSPSKWHRELVDEDKEDEHFAIISNTNRPRVGDYEKKIITFLSERNLSSALKVLDEEMEENLVKPNQKVFNLLIHACGKAGYASKASELLFRYKSRANIKFSMYADVFHACANAPNETRGECLQIAKRLRKSLQKDYQRSLTIPLYNTMIAAFGRNGGTDIAFEIIDEMSQKNVLISTDTYNHLLQACIGDKESGFRLSMAIYRRMLEKKISPDLHTFNLILRATRDCGIGSAKVINDLLLESMTSRQVRKFMDRLQKQESKLLETKNSKERSENYILDINELSNHIENPKPNLLSRNPNLDSICGVSNNVMTSHDKLQMLGDLDGFVHVVQEEFGVALNIQSFSLLMNCISVQDEDKLLQLAQHAQPDVDFYNQLMRKRVQRKDYLGANDIIDEMNKCDITPNIVTFGCMAMTCQNSKAIFDFLASMKSLDMTPNVVIMTKLINNASVMKRPDLVQHLLKKVDSYGLQPNSHLLKALDNFYVKYSQLMIDIERGKIEVRKNTWLHTEFSSGQPKWSEFCSYYNNWVRTRSIKLPKHQWAQYYTARDNKRRVR